jgi:ribonuclease-3
LNEQEPHEKKPRTTDAEPASPGDAAEGADRPSDVEIRLTACQQGIGYAFTRPELLLEALQHASAAGGGGNYERLEFLGDAVLDLYASEMLFRRFPDWREGTLTEVRARAVNGETLAELARGLGLDRWVVLGPGVAPAGRLPVSIAAAVLEAVVGAVYLDGGEPAARQLIERIFGPVLDAASAGGYDSNFKAKLQEYAQSTFGRIPSFRVIRSEGPEHGKTFHVATDIDGHVVGRGSGKSKKEAEREAARDALGKVSAEG